LFFPIATFAFSLLREPCFGCPAFFYLFRSAFVFWDTTKQSCLPTLTRGCKIGWAFFLARSGEDYTTVAFFFGGCVFSFLFGPRFVFAYSTPPMRANGITLISRATFSVTGIVYFLPRDHEYSCIERERKRDNLFYFIFSQLYRFELRVLSPHFPTCIFFREIFLISCRL